MLAIKKIDHVGIRVKNKSCSVEFYQQLGFNLISDIGFEKGHPVIMQHDCGVVINLLGPSAADEKTNVLMDIDKKHAGYTHIALRVDSIEEAKQFFQQHNIELTGSFQFKDLKAVFIRDPDRNVIEFDEYAGVEPETRINNDVNQIGYVDHP